MKDGYILFKFLDGNDARIASFNLVKHLNGTKFRPQSCLDLPESNVKVKWQESLSDGDFNHDGYYEAVVLAIASSVATLTFKAKALKCKMAPRPMLELPGPQSAPEEKIGKTRGTRQQTTSASNGDNGTVLPLPKKKGHRNSSPQKPKNPKRKRMTANDSTIKRLRGIEKLALTTNPLMGAIVNDEDEDDLGLKLDSPKPKPLPGEKIDVELESLNQPSTSTAPQTDLAAMLKQSKKLNVQLQNEVASLESKNLSLKKKVKTLEKRNEKLQDLLAGAASRCVDNSHSIKDDIEDASTPRKQDLKESTLSHVSSPKVNQELVDQDTRNSAHVSSPKVNQELVVKDSRNSGDTIASNDEPVAPPATPSMFIQKKGKKNDLADLEDPFFKKTCSQVLAHLSGAEPLLEDEDGKIIVGNFDVMKDKFEENFKNNKLDVIKATKNLTAMAWVEKERIERSLTGKINNRHGGEPKLKASPKKVLSVLACVKAHMINCGDKDNAQLTQSLRQCEKAIGVKFSSDAQAVKRQQPK